MSADLGLPWRTFDVHIVPWRAVLRHGGDETTLTADKLLDACAAIELDRQPGAAVRAAIEHRARGRRAALPWSDLVAGAHGLRRSDAPGTMTLGQCLAGMRVELVAFEWKGTT